jgi:hypothetical protein
VKLDTAIRRRRATATPPVLTAPSDDCLACSAPATVEILVGVGLEPPWLAPLCTPCSGDFSRGGLDAIGRVDAALRLARRRRAA